MQENVINNIEKIRDVGVHEIFVKLCIPNNWSTDDTNKIYYVGTKSSPDTLIMGQITGNIARLFAYVINYSHSGEWKLIRRIDKWIDAKWTSDSYFYNFANSETLSHCVKHWNLVDGQLC